MGVAALYILGIFFLVGLYAPLLASSKPLLVSWNGKLYSPLLRYLFYSGYYTKPIDLFYNLMMFTFPIGLIGSLLLKRKILFLSCVATLHVLLFTIILFGFVKNPASDRKLEHARNEALLASRVYREDPLLAPPQSHATWEFDLNYMAPYQQLNHILHYRQTSEQQRKLKPYTTAFKEATGREAPTLFAVEERHLATTKEQLKQTLLKTEESYNKAFVALPALLEAYRPHSHAYLMAKYEGGPADEMLKIVAITRKPLLEAREIIEAYQKTAASLAYLEAKWAWLNAQNTRLHILIPPLVRSFHWEEDAGGAQTLNSFLPWWELTRINRKDLLASLLFGIRISLVVGVSTIALALLIGLPMGMCAGYFAGKWDLFICRLVEVWEAMPTFFMLLLIVAITQSKSVFLVIAVLGLFGWTSFCRFLRAEVLKQRNLPYVLACKSVGYPTPRILFSHILPNAIPPILTLLPFSMMAAITSEAGISFLGLGEEGATSWGVLMDEGRSVFPAESYLLWPPAILLTLLLISIALVGDTLRDAIDPKMRDY